MTVVVTGAAGHIGGTLVRCLVAQGRHVRALVHEDRRALEGLDVERVQGDVRDPSSLRRAFEGAQVIYHAAGHISITRSDWSLLYATNVLGTRNVVEACLDCRVGRLIHFSSIHALEQRPLDVPVDESRPLVEGQRCAPYDRSKAAAELEVRKGVARGLDAVILNPTAVVGPYDYRPSHFGQVLLALARGRLPALVTGGFDWVDVRDVTGGAIRAEQHGSSGARYLLPGHWVSVPEIARLVQAITGARVSRPAVPLSLAYLGAPAATALAHLLGKRPLFTRVALDALQSNHEVCHERATRELGYEPRPFRQTLWDTLDWFREAGYLDRPLAAPFPGAT